MKPRKPLRRIPPRSEFSKESFRLLFHHHPIPMWVCDLKTLAFLEVNDAAMEKYGYSHEEFLNMTLKDLRPPEDVPRLLDDVSKKRQELQHSGEWRHKLKNGRIIDVEITSHTLEHNGRNLVLVIAQDITESKRAEDELQRQKELLQTIVDNIPVMISFIDPAGRTRWVNRQWERALGWSSEEAISRDILPDMYPDPEVRQQVLDFALAGSGAWGDFRTCVKGGHVIDTSWTNVLLSDGTSIGLGMDITERKKSEEALRSSEEKYRSLIYHMNDGLLVADNNDTIQFVNEKLCKMVGYLREELIGNICYRMLLPKKSWKSIQEKNRQRVQDISQQYEIEMRKKSGERFWVSVSASPLYGSKGEVVGSMAIISDISVRKLDEEASRKATEEIEKAHKQLVELNKHLTEVREEERARISREIHDELGQSLTALKIDLNWAREYVAKKPAIKRRLNTMLHIVNNTIKNVQRIASELRPGIIDDLGLAPAIEWYCEEFEKRSGITCRTNLEETHLKDSHKKLTLFRILQEALTNVIRHAHATTIEVKLRRLGGNVNLEINDDGIGISRKKLIAHNSLGLIGMRERTKQFNGRFEIFPEKRKGTTVRISFPIHS